MIDDIKFIKVILVLFTAVPGSYLVAFLLLNGSESYVYQEVSWIFIALIYMGLYIFEVLKHDN